MLHLLYGYCQRPKYWKIKSTLQKYMEFEQQELARRAAKKQKLMAYKQLTKKKTKLPRPKFNPRAYTKAIGNPFGVKKK